MVVLICGLNSYLGRRAASNLNNEDFKVHGLVRDIDLFNAVTFEPVTSELYHLDLLKYKRTQPKFKVPSFDLGIYFTESPFLGDKLGLQMELTRLKNFVSLLKSNHTNRILFVARIIDKDYIQFVQNLLEEYKTKFTVILCNIALGKESLADRYFRKLLTEKVVLYDKGLADVEFRPIGALDIYRWLRSIDWSSLFHNEIIELGGIQSMSVQKLYRLYRELNKVENKGVLVPKFLHNIMLRSSKLLHRDDVLEIKRMLRYEYPLDNTYWAKKVAFSFTPIEKVILQDI